MDGTRVRLLQHSLAGTSAHAEVLELRDAVQGFCDAAPVFNACLFNLYRNGVDSMGWHRDNEPEIDPACIASVSFGATRDFAIRHRQTKEKWMVSLGHGDLWSWKTCSAILTTPCPSD